MKKFKPCNFRETECDKFLYSLLESITEVDVSYIKYNYHDEQNSSLCKDFTHVERTFAYELYHQWSNSLIKYHITNYRIDAELPKQFVDQIVGNVSNGRDYETCYPDMVLHKSQGDDSGNMIACEFKRVSNTGPKKVTDDLNKLCSYVSENTEIKRSNSDQWTPYKYGVFLIIDKDDENLSETLNKKIQNVSINFNKKTLHKIICTIYDGTNLVYEYLENLIQSDHID